MNQPKKLKPGQRQLAGSQSLAGSQTLAICGLELAAYLLHNYERFSDEDIDRLKQIFTLLGKMLNNLTAVTAADAGNNLESLRDQKVREFSSYFDQLGGEKDPMKFRRLYEQCDEIVRFMENHQWDGMRLRSRGLRNQLDKFRTSYNSSR